MSTSERWVALSSSKPGGGLSLVMKIGSSANAKGEAKVIETVRSSVKLYCQRRIMVSLPRVIGVYLVGTSLLPHCLRVKKRQPGVAGVGIVVVGGGVGHLSVKKKDLTPVFLTPVFFFFKSAQLS